MGEARDQIVVRGVRGTGYHGVFAGERESGQEFSADIVVDFDASAPAASDALADTVDYAAVADIAYGFITGEPVSLIEKLAVQIADACLALPLVAAVEVTVHKPHAPITVPFDDVEVRVRRRRDA